MPRLDLRAAGLCRQGSALLPEEGHQAAAKEGRVYLGRGAVACRTVARMERSVIRETRSACKTNPDYASLHPGYETHSSAGSTVISGHSVFHRAAFAS